MCASFAAAYAAAQSGDTIGVTGTLGVQAIPSGSKTVTFKGQSGNLERAISIDADNVTLDGINLDCGGIKCADQTFLNGGGNNVTVKNSSIGNIVDGKGAMTDGVNQVFDNVRFHDVIIHTAGVHDGPSSANFNQGMVIRNSTFTNCATMDASIGTATWWGQDLHWNTLTLENNRFERPRLEDGTCCNAYSLALWATQYVAASPSSYGTMHRPTIRNNYIEPGFVDRLSDDGSNVLCGNTGDATCRPDTPSPATAAPTGKGMRTCIPSRR